VPEFSSGHARVPPLLCLANASVPDAAPVAAVDSERLDSRQRTARRPALLMGLYVSIGLVQALEAQAPTRALHSGMGPKGIHSPVPLRPTLRC
jgi:hypothetical protein